MGGDEGATVRHPSMVQANKWPCRQSAGCYSHTGHSVLVPATIPKRPLPACARCHGRCHPHLPRATCRPHASATCQVDTRDILFIVGGAFVDLDRQMVDSRVQGSMGFGNKVRAARTLCGQMIVITHALMVWAPGTRCERHEYCVQMIVMIHALVVWASEIWCAGQHEIWERVAWWWGIAVDAVRRSFGRIAQRTGAKCRPCLP